MPAEFLHLIQDFDYFLKSQTPICNLSRDMDIGRVKRVKTEPEKGSVDIQNLPAESPIDKVVPRNESPQMSNLEETDHDDDVVPRLVSLNGQSREPAPAELISLHNSLAKPWADEMIAASGGLYIDGENLLEYHVNGSGSVAQCQSQPQENVFHQASIGSPSTNLLTPPSFHHYSLPDRHVKDNI